MLSPSQLLTRPGVSGLGRAGHSVLVRQKGGVGRGRCSPASRHQARRPPSPAPAWHSPLSRAG